MDTASSSRRIFVELSPMSSGIIEHRAGVLVVGHIPLLSPQCRHCCHHDPDSGRVVLVVIPVVRDFGLLTPKQASGLGFTALGPDSEA